jgi:capping protein beta
MKRFASPEEAGRDLIRHTDPKGVEERIFEVIKLNPATTEDILAQIDVPLKTATDSAGNQYVLCDYNRDSDSYRSPFTNAYLPALPKGIVLPDDLREMEVMANRGFQSYLRQYFDSGVISVYCWECDNHAFGVGVFVKKDITGAAQGLNQISGSISCSDVCEVRAVSRQQKLYRYSLVSSAIVARHWSCRSGKPIALGGNVNDAREADGVAAKNLDHLVTIGGMIEANADRFVEKIRGIYASKMREILSYMKVDTERGVSQKAQDLVAGGLKA